MRHNSGCIPVRDVHCRHLWCCSLHVLCCVVLASVLPQQQHPASVRGIQLFAAPTLHFISAFRRNTHPSASTAIMQLGTAPMRSMASMRPRVNLRVSPCTPVCVGIKPLPIRRRPVEVREVGWGSTKGWAPAIPPTCRALRLLLHAQSNHNTHTTTQPCMLLAAFRGADLDMGI